MKITALLLLLIASLSTSPMFAQSEEQAGAYGVTFTPPDGWTMTTETDPSWTKFRLRQAGGLPKVMIQIFSSNVTPVSALDAYVTAHRTKYRENGWQFTQTPTSETFGRRRFSGRQLIYTANNTTYSQRFFALELSGHTVLVMSLSKIEGGWNYWGYNTYVPDDLGPIAGSLQGISTPQVTAE